jgi:hypothetical protein
MAKTYYGYVAREDKAYVDWASIGKTISDDLIEVSKSRQEQRDELDRKTEESITNINKLTADQPQLVSEFYMDGANDMRQYLLMLQKEMKAGRLQPNEYLKKKQVLMDGVDQLSLASKDFAADYEEALKRLQKDAAGQEVFQNEKYDAFRSTEGKGIYVNPVNGRLYIGTRDENGVIDSNPSKLLDVNNLYSRRKDQINKYDVVGEASTKVAPLGDYIRSVRRGGVFTLKDIMQRKEYLKAENDIIQSMMSSPRNLGSILSDYVGGYTFTENEEEAKADPAKILLKKDGMNLLQPQLTDEQRKAAEEALRAQLRVQLDRVETAMPIQQEQQWQYQRGQEQRREQQNVGMWHSLAFGTASEQNTAANQLLGSQKAQELGLVKIEPIGTSVKLTYDGSGSMGAGTRTFDASGKTAREWAAIGNELHGVDDVNRALTAAGVSNPSQVFAGSLQGTSAERTRTNIMQDVPVYVTSNLADITDEEFKNDLEGKMAAKLETALGSLGFTIDTDVWDDAVIITSPPVDGKPGASMTFTVDNSEGSSDNRQTIIDFVTANITPDTVAKLKSSGRLNVSSQNNDEEAPNTAKYNKPQG